MLQKIRNRKRRSMAFRSNASQSSAWYDTCRFCNPESPNLITGHMAYHGWAQFCSGHLQPWAVRGKRRFVFRSAAILEHTAIPVEYFNFRLWRGKHCITTLVFMTRPAALLSTATCQLTISEPSSRSYTPCRCPFITYMPIPH
jgi:hypothetical protein